MNEALYLSPPLPGYTYAPMSDFWYSPDFDYSFKSNIRSEVLPDEVIEDYLQHEQPAAYYPSESHYYQQIRSAPVLSMQNANYTIPPSDPWSFYPHAYQNFMNYIATGRSRSNSATSTTCPPVDNVALRSLPTSSPDTETTGQIKLEESSASKPSDEEEEDLDSHKPYARLIYEALLEAPGHRMMLKDIYDWFQRNTTKPQESGTNGWQNSIRHNLSMNKAFENDKKESCCRRGASRKSNSIWALTEEAIRNGIQSTTRYRKAGSGKKSSGNKKPAIQRQKSGAKGGRAARRSARLRKHEQSTPTRSNVLEETIVPIGMFSESSNEQQFPMTDSLEVRNRRKPPENRAALFQLQLDEPEFQPGLDYDPRKFDCEPSHPNDLSTSGLFHYVRDRDLAFENCSRLPMNSSASNLTAPCL